MRRAPLEAGGQVAEVRELIRRLASDGRTVVLSSGRPAASAYAEGLAEAAGAIDRAGLRA
jgi:hypothetical protein